ncbi:protein FATTY ACID EXPORT 3, chloroplastic isoform X2 [Ricinus communis]|uniref:protein FATTY ACID EXPORT 3, chloroplastic isoform X2 n=1 Tax=Ricinus communis TaxID=3988 RepID=UPI000772CD95|nr:protein FATTY ACID EXPORT 3, chloroplastic isoform X2 [Ricinus communis]|eukprot:XP_015580573.1 protein FATTY ACID EXPORT 3, chloroplastic isoform X2 [Ricinus communis]
MSVAAQLLAVKNPYCFPLNKPSLYSSSTSFSPSPSLKFQPLLKPKGLGIGISIGFPSLHRRNSFLPLSASHEESHSEIDVEREKNEEEETQEDWKRILDSFKLKMQSLSGESYEEYSKKAMVVLRETQDQLQVLSDKLQTNLSEITKEVAVGSKEYLSTAAENSPEPVKEIVESLASSTDDLNEISQVRDFHVGIPYGLLLSSGGFLSFMLTGSISAIRFGMILGAALLALSISSLKSFKKGQAHAGALKGQTAIAAVIFLREIGFLFERASLFTFFSTVISGAVVAFYLYRIVSSGKQTKGSDPQGAEN